jgi:hypothetical protein
MDHHTNPALLEAHACRGFLIEYFLYDLDLQEVVTGTEGATLI